MEKDVVLTQFSVIVSTVFHMILTISLKDPARLNCHMRIII